jgi:hypothetical protein
MITKIEATGGFCGASEYDKNEHVNGELTAAIAINPMTHNEKSSQRYAGSSLPGRKASYSASCGPSPTLC